MKIRFPHIIRLLFAGFIMAAPGAVMAITLQLSWVGGNGYSLTGLFSYDDSLVNTGIIDETSIDTFMIQGFDGSTSLGTWNLADGSDSIYDFNFNFDTTSLAFVVGGISQSTSGQSWNRRATGVGFESGDNHQVLTLNGVALDQNWNPTVNSQILTSDSTLVATVVPVPGAIYLLGSGLIALVGAGKRRNQSSAAA